MKTIVHVQRMVPYPVFCNVDKPSESFYKQAPYLDFKYHLGQEWTGTRKEIKCLKKEFDELDSVGMKIRQVSQMQRRRNMI